MALTRGMLVIRDAQFEALVAPSLEALVRRTVAAARERWPEACARHGEEALKDLARKAARKCARYELDEPEQVLAWLGWMFTLGSDFDEELPWVKAIVEDPKKGGSMKLLEIEEADEREFARLSEPSDDLEATTVFMTDEDEDEGGRS